MRFKFLLLIFFAVPSLISAQCDYPEGVDTTLIISEARLISDNWTYLELTNVGQTPLFLSSFKIGKLADLSWSGGIFDLCNDLWWMPGRPAYVFLPEEVLMPGKSWTITTAYDFGPEFYKKYEGRRGGSERPKQPEMYELADKLIHREESIEGVNYPGDKVSTPYNDPEQTVRRGEYANLYTAVGGGTYFLEYHTDYDSVIVDQIGGFFDADNGRNIRGKDYDVAGVSDALGNSVLVRKATVKSGNIDFASGAGANIAESEWLPIQMPSGYDQWRDVWWTIGNHGNYVLEENTLEPTLDDITVDYANKEITVPWGIRRLDDIMRNMKRKPGLAWNYVLNDVKADSLYRSAQTGDRLIVYAVGNTLMTDTFDIIVNEPTADDNLVIPVDHPNSWGNLITTRAQNGILDWPRVTKHESGIDTITGEGFGLEFDMRVDTLLKYLEKPENATWEIVWVDDVARPDLKNGDILKVTSESGQVKEYFIQVQTYLPSGNANLSAITWPDIPEKNRGIMGWKGDTIPGFAASTKQYQLTVPFDYPGIPALVPITQHYNASVKTTRARTMRGDKEDRTIVFEVTAEDDTTTQVYRVELVKGKDPKKVEPYESEPFISEFVNDHGPGSFLEIFNPGNQPIDLRHYVIGKNKNTDENYGPISSTPGWQYRYTTYVPGTKYVDSATYQIYPEHLFNDVATNAIIPGGDVFVLAQFGGTPSYAPPYDINLDGDGNPWGETIFGSSSRGTPLPPNGNRQNSIYLYKILNDSVVPSGQDMSLKPVDDVNDFELIDVWGMPEAPFEWIVGDYVFGNNESHTIHKRKPHIIQGNPVRGMSFGYDPISQTYSDERSEWINIKPSIEYWRLSGDEQLRVALGGLGSHYMDPITFFKSTVKSTAYKVSVGYGHDQEIFGIVTGTTVSEFFDNIIKEDVDQALTLKSGSDTATVIEDGVILPDDILEVISADSTGMTYYRLDVTDEGLSDDALLTSDSWNIELSTSPDPDQDVIGEADISSFDYDVTLKSLLENINVPAGAALDVIDNEGDYVPLSYINYSDTTYVDVTVSHDMALDVLAEDGKTRIMYNLVPNSTDADAFIKSSIYDVSQDDLLIEYVPLGTDFDAFLNNVIYSKGSTIKLIDKFGNERTSGTIKADDIVEITSANGEVTKSYRISLLFPGQSLVYLAYVTSETYNVDEFNYVISGTSETPLTIGTSMEFFMQQLLPAAGADVILYDATGQQKSSGDLAEGDYIQVIAGDGSSMAYYQLNLVTSARMPEFARFEIYPNPTSGILNINGLDAGNRIQIYNNQGVLLEMLEADSNKETLSLESVPDGLLLIVISDKNQVLGQFKTIKK
ncbi:MAG TPA: T9SS type A sorting domain-containing protein [Bacteroidales bacterium]|nr:T9SS type A sorting domain-containing protein [Bacteroidales bacterium]